MWLLCPSPRRPNMGRFDPAPQVTGWSVRAKGEKLCPGAPEPVEGRVVIKDPVIPHKCPAMEVGPAKISVM